MWTSAPTGSGVSLRVPGVHAEEGGGSVFAVAGPLAEELRALATWLGLERVKIETSATGDLAGRLRREFF